MPAPDMPTAVQRARKMKTTAIVVCVALAPLAGHGCPPLEVEAIQRAHCVVAVTIEGVSAGGALPEGATATVYTAAVSAVLYGNCASNAPVRFTVRPSKPVAPLEKGTKCFAYLRRAPAGGAAGAPPWETASGERGLQKDTPPLRKLVDGMVASRKAMDAFLAREEKREDLSPIERKLHAIIIPEFDFCCASVYDVVQLFSEVSVEFDKSPAGDTPRGVPISFEPAKAGGEPGLVRYYAENASLLTHLRILDWIGYAHTLADGHVHVRERPMPAQGQQPPDREK